MSDGALIKYDAACRAIAKAKSVDEVKNIRNRSEALKAYARQAKNKDLEADALEIRMRATRRLDELKEEQRQTIGLAKGGDKGGRRPKAGVRKTPANAPATLADAGIDKNLAKEMRALGPKKLSSEEFERAVAAARKAITKTVATATRRDNKKERRAERERALARKIRAMPDGKFGVIVEDFEWDHVTWSEAGKDRHASNHYPTASDAHTAEEIVERTRERFACAADDCVLFMWTTVPHLAIALDVLRLRGFEYVSGYVWGKDRISTGYWNRNKHEHLLIGVKGNIPCPSSGTQWDSLLMAPVGEHSAKPEIFLEMIEQYFPNIPKIELNRRGPARSGWDAWGNEAIAEAAE